MEENVADSKAGLERSPRSSMQGIALAMALCWQGHSPTLGPPPDSVFRPICHDEGWPMFGHSPLHDRRIAVKGPAPQFPMVGIDCPEDLKFTADDWVAVVDYAIQLVGEDHVALGSDFDGGPTPPRGMRDIRDLAMITDAMLRRGYSEERIRKFLGGNFLRVFHQITEPPLSRPTPERRQQSPR